MVFYFIAQSGLVLSRRSASNFYNYTIPEKYRGQVVAAAESAHLGGGGLEYPQEFIENLGRWDREGLSMVYAHA